MYSEAIIPFLSKSSNPHCVEQLHLYSEQILFYNQRFNLISKKDESKIWTRHFLDSLQITQHPFIHEMLNVSRETSDILTWVDMGSGAGFPIIPLAIFYPEIQFTAIEPRQKRATFLKVVQNRISLPNFQVFTGKAEDYTSSAQVVSCRALGSFQEDQTRAFRILQSGGVFITLKSLQDIHQFVDSITTIEYQLPETSHTYCVVACRK